MMRRNRSSALFAYYLANLNTLNNSLKTRSDKLPHFHNIQGVALSDYMRIDSLINQIRAENSWSEDQLKSDLTILIKNRIYLVKDLRSLSKERWEQIELLPVVKDLLSEAINHGYVNSEKEKRRKKNGTRPTSEPKKIEIKVDTKDSMIKKESAKPLLGLPSSHDEKLRMRLRSQSVNSPNEKPTLFLPSPKKKVEGNRMKIKTTNGEIYEVDRWCPHARTDLSARGVVMGSKLVCTKHNWSFDLENGGMCTGNAGNVSINACLVNDW